MKISMRRKRKDSISDQLSIYPRLIVTGGLNCELAKVAQIIHREMIHQPAG